MRQEADDSEDQQSAYPSMPPAATAVASMTIVTTVR